LGQVNGWLFGINPNKVPESVRPALVAYQQECFSVLHKHFLPNGVQDLTKFIENMTGFQTEVRENFQRMEAVCGGLRTELDELKIKYDLFVSDDDDKLINNLIVRIKVEKSMDGRAIVGHVKRTLNLCAIYKSPNARDIINVLKNLLGEGLRLVPNAK
jgi:hypothetical protein